MSEFDYKNCLDVELKFCSKVIRQYVKLKRENLDYVVFFRIGEFYETYFEDAILISNECEITLTKRNIGNNKGTIPMAGVPHHSANSYIKKLLDKNYKVAVCEQSETRDESGILERRVVRKYTNGTLLDDEFLDSDKNNYIAALYAENEDYGLAYCDLTTGEFEITTGNFSDIQSELFKICPSELLVPLKPRDIKPFSVIERPETTLPNNLISSFNTTIIPLKYYSSNLIKQTDSEFRLGFKSANAIISYVLETQRDFAPKLDKVSTYLISDYLILDEVARRNLELTRNAFDFKKQNSLLSTLDNTKTSMGSRLLKSWINKPLVDTLKITMRQNAIKELFEKQTFANEIENVLENCYDIPRLCTKISNNTITLKDFISLKETILTIKPLKNICKNFTSPILNFINNELSSLLDFADILDKTINELDENSIKDGANAELDYIKDLIKKNKDWFKEYERQLREEFGIKNLKISSNKIFGYFIEIPLNQIKLVPRFFNRKQTLSSSERFSTEVLMEHELEISHLKLKASEIELDILAKLRKYSCEMLDLIREFANYLTQLDVIFSLYKSAQINNYVCPNIVNNFSIKKARHATVEKTVEKFVANDIDFKIPFKLLTGPNMSGKSTFMRSCALIAIMAQIGSFVPAKEANLPLVDKIFVRIASGDNLTQNNSTFMVEMVEVANILNNATKNSFILLDELGRGTSTLDGVAIARSVAEYIIENIGAKTIFATHYHQLKALAQDLPLVENLMINNFVVQQGFMNQSYGVEVAKKANLPKSVIERATKYLHSCHVK